MAQQKKLIAVYSVLSVLFLGLYIGAQFLPDPLVFYTDKFMWTFGAFTKEFFSNLALILFAVSLVALINASITFKKFRDTKLSQVTYYLICLRSVLTRIASIRNYSGSDWHTVLLQQLRYKLIERYDEIIMYCDKIYELRLTELSDAKREQLYTTIVNQTENVRDQIEMLKSALYFANENEALKNCMDAQRRTIVNNRYIQNIDDLVLETLKQNKSHSKRRELSDSYKKCVIQEQPGNESVVVSA